METKFTHKISGLITQYHLEADAGTLWNSLSLISVVKAVAKTGLRDSAAYQLQLADWLLSAGGSFCCIWNGLWLPPGFLAGILVITDRVKLKPAVRRWHETNAAHVQSDIRYYL